MICNLKSLGKACLALFAIGAAMAPTAAAESFTFRSDATSTTYTGEGEGAGKEVLRTTAGAVSCEKVTYTGSQSGDEASEFEVTPTYSGCTAFGSLSAEINMNGCKYRFTTGTLEGTKFEGTVDIVCAAEKQIVVTARQLGITKCTVDVPAQNGLKTVTYTNISPAPTDIKADLNLSGIKYTQTAGSGLGACTTTTDETGTDESTDDFRGETVREGKTEEVGIAGDRIGTWITASKLEFFTSNKGDRKASKIYNGHAITRYINSIKIVNNLEEQKEEDFTIVANSCGTLNATEECEVTVEFKSGTHGVNRWLRVEWGGWWPWSTTHVRKADIAS
ncbi:MAG TPA: hypothetical protein VFS64_00330 [Solirubrobacterales bacterium]|nr:hypothetical protein [Solirubrobacterales bacterium]